MTNMASASAPTQAITNIFPSRVPPDLRNRIYEPLVQDTDTAIILSKPMKVLIRNPDVAPVWKDIKVANGHGLAKACKGLSAEFCDITEGRALEFKNISQVVAHVFDLDFKNLTEGFLKHVDASARNPMRSIDIKVFFTFTDRFQGLAEHEAEARLTRWLDYRQQTKTRGEYVPLEYFIKTIEGPTDKVRDLFNSMIYKSYHSHEFKRILEPIRSIFEDELSYEDWLSGAQDGESEDDEEDAIDVDNAANTGETTATKGEWGARVQKQIEPRRSRRQTARAARY